MKASLSSEEKVIAAYLSICREWDQRDIAIALNVNNVGRVNEAIKAVEKAVGISAGGYKDR